MKYRGEVDGLRAIAVLPVILFHAGFELFSGGFVGVDVFFVISGYLITGIIVEEHAAGKFTIANFYERRARRILPALFVVMAVSIPFAWVWLTPADLKDFAQSLVAISLFGSNILFWRESGYFATAAEFKPMLHTWSLAVEEQYYLLFPLFLMLIWRIGKARVMVVIGVIAVGSFAIAQWGAIHRPTAAFFLLPTRAWELLLGAAVALHLFGRDRPVARGAAEAGSLLGLALIAYSVFAYDKSTVFPGVAALAPTVGTALVILFATPQTVVGKVLNTRLLIGVGLISYSAYLWHQPLFVFARHRALEEPDAAVFLALAVCALVLGYLTWRFVERPFRNRQAVSRKQIFTFSAAGTAVFFLVGLAGSLQAGFPSRLTESQRQISATVARQFGDRLDAVGLDKCDFGEKRSKIGFEAFLSRLDQCRTGEGKRLPLMVAGDSHAADVAIAFRQNGYAVLQVSGARCNLTPLMMPRQCRRMFDALQKVGSDPFYTHIVLANRFTKDELTLPAMNAMVDYWSSQGKKLILLTGMPEFPQYKSHLIRGATPRLRRDLPGGEFDASVRAMLTARGVHVVSSADALCKVAACSHRASGGELLYVDDDHLSLFGARKFGEVLVQNDPVIRDLANRAAAPGSPTP